jgi:hypothetical protein
MRPQARRAAIEHLGPTKGTEVGLGVQFISPRNTSAASDSRHKLSRNADSAVSYLLKSMQVWAAPAYRQGAGQMRGLDRT